VSQPNVADPARELAELIYFDARRETVDWERSLENLKRLGRDLVYTEDMMRACLLRLVNRFHTDLTGVLWPKTANEVARHLLKLAAEEDKQFHLY
jgi:hypothetical protein